MSKAFPRRPSPRQAPPTPEQVRQAREDWTLHRQSLFTTQCIAYGCDETWPCTRFRAAVPILERASQFDVNGWLRPEATEEKTGCAAVPGSRTVTGVERNGGEPRTSYWASASWRDEAVGWITAVTDRHGVRVTGEITQPRTRFWSTQLTVPTDAGTLWFKENCPGQECEARLVARLAELVPDHVVAPVAIEESRGWMLTPDGGPTMHSVAGDDIDTWVRVVAEWSDLQRRLAGHTEALLATGVRNMPPTAASGYLAERVDALAALPVGHPAHLDATTAGRFRALLPLVDQWATQLEATGLPLTLDHNDLHANNAFQPRDGEPRLRFFDFADAVVSHPFCSLLVPLRVLARQLDTAPDDPRLRPVVDGYLRAWSDLADPAVLRDAVAPAMQLGRLNRSESWRRVLPWASAEERAEFGSPDVAWLTTLLPH